MTGTSTLPKASRPPSAGFSITQPIPHRRAPLSETSLASAPVRLLQGLADTEVPWRTALRLLEALAARDVRVQLLKDGDHRLSSPTHLDLLGDTLAELLETVSQD